MTFADRLARRAAAMPRRIALPEAGDPRVREAAGVLERRGIAQPVLDFGSVGGSGAPGEAGSRPGGEGSRSGGQGGAGRLAAAMQMLAAGAVDGVVAGATCPTADVVRAALRHVGLRDGVRTLSSSFFLEVREFRAAGGEVLSFADPGVVLDPAADQLAEIAAEAVDLRRRVVGDEPRVAFLSYSTAGSAAGPSAEKMREAARLFRRSRPDTPCDGETQADVALVPGVARRKWPGSAVQGRANVLVFPNLDAANIGYKLTQHLAGAPAWGPILQGLAAPAADLSRGASAAEIVTVAAITALTAGGEPAAD